MGSNVGLDNAAAGRASGSGARRLARGPACHWRRPTRRPRPPVAGLGRQVMVVEDNLINQRVVVACWVRLGVAGVRGPACSASSACGRATSPT